MCHEQGDLTLRVAPTPRPSEEGALASPAPAHGRQTTALPQQVFTQSNLDINFSKLCCQACSCRRQVWQVDSRINMLQRHWSLSHPVCRAIREA